LPIWQGFQKTGGLTFSKKSTLNSLERGTLHKLTGAARRREPVDQKFSRILWPVVLQTYRAIFWSRWSGSNRRPLFYPSAIASLFN